MIEWALAAIVFGGLVAIVVYRDELGRLWRPALGVLVFIAGLWVGRITARRGEGSPQGAQAAPSHGDKGEGIGARHHDNLDELTRPPAGEYATTSDGDLAAWLDERARSGK
jgi:hypothetical protein